MSLNPLRYFLRAGGSVSVLYALSNSATTIAYISILTHTLSLPPSIRSAEQTQTEHTYIRKSPKALDSLSTTRPGTDESVGLRQPHH